jgi:hypothetical protein
MGIPESADSSRYLARFSAFVALTVGLFVYGGWVFDVEQLTNLVPSWPKMSRLTALEFFAAGCALWFTTINARRLALGTATLVTAVGLLILFRYVFSWDIYLDQLSLAPMPDAMEGTIPPRMAPSTAVAFCCFGLSLVCSFY